MALALADRVQQSGTANTTVSFTLSGSVAGFQSFAVVGNGNTTYYAATDASGNWEVGIGTYATSGPTLTRTTILSSSNSGSAVTFSGTVNVFVTYPSERAIYGDTTGTISPLDNAITRFDTTAGNIIQTSLVTIADDGAITAPSVGSIIPFYFSSTLPAAGPYHGAVAHLHSTGKLYYAHSSAWQIITSGLGTASTTGVVTPVGSSGQLLTNDGQGGLTSNTTGTGVVTALGTNVGSAGAFVTFNGALGTPSSGTATYLTGLPLSTGVTGTLPVANGGTSLATLTANNVILGNGTSAPTFVAPSTSGNVLTSNGTTWQSTAPAASGATKGQAIAFSMIFGL